MSLQDDLDDDDNLIVRKKVHEGYLLKKGQINRSWKKRWFILYEDRKFAYYISKELSNLPAINEINLSTVKSINLIPYSNNPNKQRAKQRAKSLAGMFKSSIRKSSLSSGNTPVSPSTPNTPSIDNNDDDYYNNDIINQNKKNDIASSNHQSIWVDAALNNSVCCSKPNVFELRTNKRTYWLHCSSSDILNAWIVHLKYSIFGKLIISGYLLKKLKTKWKKRYFQVFEEGKTIRIYKSNKKYKEKGTIDLTNIAIIKLSTYDVHKKPFPIEIISKNDYHSNHTTATHVISCSNKLIRNQWCDAFYMSMKGKKLEILCEGYLYFRSDQSKYWKKSYCALIEGSLIIFNAESDCNDFKNCIYNSEEYYNKAFNEYVSRSLPMIDPFIEKINNKQLINNKNDEEYKYSIPDSLLATLQIFTITTAIGKWYCGTEEPIKFLLWCQSIHKYCEQYDKYTKGGNKKKLTITDDDGINIDYYNNDKLAAVFSLSDNDDDDYDDSDNDGMNGIINNTVDDTMKDNGKQLGRRDSGKLKGNIIMSINMDKQQINNNDINDDPLFAKSVPVTRPHAVSMDLDLNFNKLAVIQGNNENTAAGISKNNKKISNDDDNKDNNGSNDDLTNIINENMLYSSTDDDDESDDDCLSITKTAVQDDLIKPMPLNVNSINSYILEDD